MSTESELASAESRAKIFNSYFGSLSSFLIPVLVVVLSLFVGFLQKEKEGKDRAAQEAIATARNEQDMRRQCLSEMRETTAMLVVNAGAHKAEYERAMVSVADGLNRVCSHLDVQLPSLVVEAAQQVAADASASPTAKAAAVSVINSQPLRVFFHIGDEAQRTRAREIELALERVQVGQAAVIVPGIQRVAVAPSRNELRYANASDGAAAQTVANSLQDLLGAPVALKPINAHVSPGILEFWMAQPNP